jgi:protein-tyrosine phosphatase
MDWAGKSRDVADPWYTGDFEATWCDVNEGCKAMLKAICNQQ